jgi:predicted dehydrogenase
VIGCGAQGAIHLDAYLRIEGVELVAVCDVDPERVERARTATGAAGFADHVELLATGGLDLVSICTMPATHREIACDALAAGAHVLCEKPMACTLSEAAAMAAAARRAGRYLTLGYNMRRMGSARLLKRAIDDGVIGRPLAIRAVMLYPQIPWWGRHYVKAANGGGVVQADAGHCLDLALWTIGYPSPLTVSASVGRTFPLKGAEGSPSPEATLAYDVEDIASAHIRLAGGAWMTLDVAWSADRAEPLYGYEIVGERGTARFDPLSLLVRRDGELVELASEDAADTEWAASVHRGIAEVVAALQRGEEPETVVENGVTIQAITDAVYASAESGREVSLAPPAACP